MRIVSTFLPPHAPKEGQQAVMLTAFDTLVDQKSVVVGITVGKVQGPDLGSVRASQVGQLIIERVADHHRLNYPNGTAVVAGVAQVAGAKERVRNVLAKAPEHAAVFLICADNKVYDAAFRALGVDYKSANLDQH